MEDYGTDANEKAMMAIDWIFGSNYKSASDRNLFENPNSKRFKEKFFSEYVDRTGLKDIVASKKAKNREEKKLVENGMKVELENVKNVASTYYTGTHKETYDLFESGKFEEGVAKNEELGYVTLYNKDGKWIYWEDIPEGEDIDANNVGTMSIEDEENAKILALDNKPDVLQLQRL